MTLSTNEYWNLFRHHKGPILRAVGICCALSLVGFFALPKRYKATASIAVQTEYFQLPLVSGFLPETMDPQELRAKREALIHRALNRQFVATIARRFQLLKDSDLESKNSYELVLLQKKFEVIPNGPSGFIVSFSSRDPNVTYQVLQEFLNHLRVTMTEERRATLLNLHDAIQDQLEALSAGKQNERSNAILAARPDLVKRRIETIERQIEALKASYSDKHPRVAELNKQLLQLQHYDPPSNEGSTSPQRQDLFAGVKVDEGSKELFDDLMKKYRYIDVVMYMDLQNKDHYLTYLTEPFIPQSPTWPKLPILLAWGVASGFLIGAGSILIPIKA